ncbi:MAG: STAS domain-containing protein [Acidimicrobiales bacterium]
MIEQSLNIDVVSCDEEDLVIVTGDLDADTCAQLRETLGGLTNRRLALDLDGLGFLDSSGLSLLLERRRHHDKLGGGVRIVRASQPVQRVLDLTGTSELLITTD